MLALRVRVQGRHPRFSRKMTGRPERPLPAGSLVRVVDRTGAFAGVGFFNPRSPVALRMLTRRDEPVDEAFFRRRLDEAVDLREGTLGLRATGNAYRLVHAEADGLPGLLLDRLGDFLVAEVHAPGILDPLEDLGLRLKERYPSARLVLTLDPRARELEGMGPLPPPAPLEGELVEWGLRYLVRPGRGHKTGFFCDQRENRRFLAGFLEGCRLLDLCCNTGGFALVAARHGKARQVVGVDLDEEAVAMAAENARRNQLSARFQHGDLFDVLRAARRGAFDAVVLDPPSWVPSRDALEAGLARYRDANRLALAALSPGGFLFTFSCSGPVSEDAFLSCLRQAAADAGRDARILALRGAGPDHPVALECPETRYLKGVLLRVR